MYKRFLIILSLLFCNISLADTINLHWLNEDGTTYQDSTCVIDSDLILPSTPPTKYGYTFTGWKIGNYVPIEYLESTGTQYIDTNYTYTNNITTVLLFSRTNTSTNDGIFGYRFTDIPSSEGNMRFFFVYSNGRVGTRFGAGRPETCSTLNSTITLNINTRYLLELKPNNAIYLDNTEIAKPCGVYSTNDFGKIYIFAANTQGYASADISYLHGKIYYIKIYDNNILVRDFIPVLDKDGVPCMFDKVEAKFYYNQGTGQFIAGPAL